ncbi:MAG: L,D-transpeptidase [Methylocystis sp.]
MDFFCRASLHGGPGAGVRQSDQSRSARRLPQCLSRTGDTAAGRLLAPFAIHARTVVISTKDRRLYYVLGDGRAIEYGVGVGRMGFTWSGEKTISRKREWPDWSPPPQMLKRRPDLPRHMAGGMENPLGARALYLGSSQYRIHGSNEPDTIGAAVSSGCIRMTNKDVVDLYSRVKVGTKVVVLN